MLTKESVNKPVCVKCGSSNMRTRVDGTHVCIRCGNQWKEEQDGKEKI